MPPPAPSFAPGAVVADRYRIEASIGEGGYGAVFRATQLALGRPVALKVLLSTLLDEDGLRRFEREAELAQRMDHPNTVRMLDFGRAADGSPFLVFELLKGQTLDAAIRTSGGGLPAARVQRIAAQMLKSLMEAHGLGIVHRDVKPANVFLCNFEGEPDFVKVLDFGIAKGVGQGPLTRSGQVVGTPSYMAPEQVMGLTVTFAADLYAVGLVMSEALSGRTVFRGASGAEIIAAQIAPIPAPHTVEVLQSPLAHVILRATQKRPELRYGSAAEMLAALQGVTGSASHDVASVPGSAPRAPSSGAGSAWGGGPPVNPAAASAPSAAVLLPTNPTVGVPDFGLAATETGVPVPSALAPAAYVPPVAFAPTVQAPPAAWAPPPPEAAPPPAKGIARWVPFVALGVAAAALGAMLVATGVGRPRAAPVQGGPAGPVGPAGPGTPTAPRRGASPLGRVRLAELTTASIMERLRDAGYEVSSNSETPMGDMKFVGVGVRVGGHDGMVFFYRCKSAESARAIEDMFHKRSDAAVSREGGVVLATTVATGTESGNARAKELLAAIIR